jgi:hypothetical protein
MENLSALMNLVTDFHKKFGIGINVRSQQEMYARCTLLLEELGELGETLAEQKHSLDEELADITYVLLGNLVSLGYYPDFSAFKCDNINSTYEELVFHCGLIARKIRKEWAPDSLRFEQGIVRLHLITFYILSDWAIKENFELTHAVVAKHAKLLKREARIIGDTVVVSHWNDNMTV